MPEFSLHRNSIFSFRSTSNWMSARMTIAMDFDFPAPKRPWIHKSSLLVRRAIVTAHSVPSTCPSISAAYERAVVRIQRVMCHLGYDLE